MSDSRIRRIAGGARRRSGRAARELMGRPVVTAPEPVVPPEPELPADVRTLVDAGLFDHRWYNRQTGAPRRSRVAAAEDYLAQPRGRGRALPNPLFDPEYYASHLSTAQQEELGEGDPFLFYLRHRTWRRPTHPLFDTRGYLQRNDEARRWRGGPLAHYRQVGREQGAQPNDWLTPDSDGRYPDLLAWIDARMSEWESRRAALRPIWRGRYDRAAERDLLASYDGRALPDGIGVSVVLEAGFDEEMLAETLGSMAAQDTRSWELFVIDRGSDVDVASVVAAAALDVPVRVVPTDDDHAGAAFNDVVAQARGTYLAFARAGETWRPERLRVLALAAADGGDRMVADVLAHRTAAGATRYAAEGHEGDRATLRAVGYSRLLLERELVVELGGEDVTLLGRRDFDLELRASYVAPLTVVPLVGTTRGARLIRGGHTRPMRFQRPIEHEHLSSWRNVALNRRLVDWDELGRREQDAGLVSVIIPTYQDWEMTTAAVESVLASDGHAGIRVECIVWDNGSDPAASINLDALAARFPQLVLAHSAVNHGFALGNNLALPFAHGATVMFLNNDTTVEPDWLEPVLERLADPGVLGVQSLLVYPTGSVQSAGVVFPSTGGLPHAFLAGFPVEDAEAVDALEFRALTGAALALRWSDVVALRGFDPIFTNGMEDVDLCQRLADTRAGAFRVVTGSPVTHFESRSPGRYDRSILNRRIWLDRWRGRDEPRDDVRLWAHQGYDVVGHELVAMGPEVSRQWLLPAPVLVRADRLHITERPRSLRWAIKNPAPAGRFGDRWGDTHFADAIARALRARGQWVTVDRLEEHERTTGRHDDVALVLRGLAPYRPSPEQVTITWVISHPEMVSRATVVESDRVLAASSLWAAQVSREWGVRVDPLLQATDPVLFNPDRAVPDTGHPVLFVGASREVVERPIVRDAVAAGLPLSVYGHGWGRFIDRRYIKSDKMPNVDLGTAYRSAGVVLNDHWEDMREQGFISNRLFDAVASGARVISDEVVGMREIFGDSVQVYATPDDLTRLSSLPDPSTVFGDDESLRKAAERIHREHSFDARAVELIEIAHEVRQARGF